MEYQIRKAQWEDLPRIEEIYANARKFMAETGNPNQWGNTTPVTSLLEDDIRKGDLYVMTYEDTIHGVFYFYIGIDPTYGVIEDGQWRSDSPYGTIHRIAGDGSGGVLATAVAFGKEHIGHLRIDTHEDNKIMQRAIAKQGFQRSGIIHLANGSPRIAYDLLIQ
ncbi:MAG: N-acetyltransferase [Oscillospiraceae bacterium]|nr:N-acetyltransferase [Oscillospiraceae bacterium]